jgi:hypothetical protein
VTGVGSWRAIFPPNYSAPQAIDIVELSGHGCAPLLHHSFPILPALCSVVFDSFLKLVCKQCKLCHTFNLVYPLGMLLVLSLDGGMASGNEVRGVWHCLLLLFGRLA